jgi:IS5 family transposase
MLIKLLVLQQLFYLSDEELEFQVNGWRSFDEFAGHGVTNSIPDERTVRPLGERLRKAGVIEELLEMFKVYLRLQGLQVHGGQIISATLVPVPKQRNTRKRTRKSKQGSYHKVGTRIQIHCGRRISDSRWARKNCIIYYGYKNSICVDIDDTSNRRFEVTPANPVDSQILPRLHNPENEHGYAWEDSAYSGKDIQDLLHLALFERLIH